MFARRDGSSGLSGITPQSRPVPSTRWPRSEGAPMKRFLSRLLSHVRPTGPRRTPAPRRPSLAVEALDRRDMPSVTLQGGVLSIQEFAAANVTVKLDPG